MEPVKVGKIIQGVAHRDAIHIAIAPVTANEHMAPGELVKFAEEGNTENAVSARVGDSAAIGIVDPFLDEVKKHERFYVFLFPQTITSLRHEWTHPAFTNKPERERANSWIANFARTIGQDYDALMGAAREFARTGNTTWAEEGSYDASSSQWEKFWLCFELVTGIKCDETDWAPFHCAC